MESTYSKRNIFIVADDLGLAKSVNDGIVFLLKEGKINSASLMANGAAFDDSIQRLKDLPSANIGVHLVLVEERPLTGVKFPKNHKTFFIKYVLGLISLKAIEKELEAQVQKILGAGIKPQFINNHQHLHLLPGIMDIVIDLAKKYGIPYIRIVNEPLVAKGSLFRKIQLGFLRLLSRSAKIKIIRNNLKCNDFFVGFINAGNLDFYDINLTKKLQSKYPDKFIELGCHPGFESAELIAKYGHWQYNWQKELEILKNSRR